MDVDDNAPTAPSLTRCNELWFDDGNIVLQAGLVQYKVYRGTLARHSPVFQDMLGFPQPAQAELVDGSPLVVLPDDVEDVTPFLRALFDPDYFRPFPARTTYEIIHGCLRMGHKYAVDFLRRRALAHFSSCWRTDRDEWNESNYFSAKMDELPSKLVSWDEGLGSLEDTEALSRRLISCALLARETEATWTLPMIFYQIANHFDSESLGLAIFHGITFQGKTLQLSLRDQKLILVGAEQQLQASWRLLRDLGDPAITTTCPLSPDSCTRGALSAAFTTKNACMLNLRNPLTVWSAEEREHCTDICQRCLERMEEKRLHATQRFWNELPELYELPSVAIPTGPAHHTAPRAEKTGKLRCNGLKLGEELSTMSVLSNPAPTITVTPAPSQSGKQAWARNPPIIPFKERVIGVAKTHERASRVAVVELQHTPMSATVGADFAGEDELIRRRAVGFQGEISAAADVCRKARWFLLRISHTSTTIARMATTFAGTLSLPPYYDPSDEFDVRIPAYTARPSLGEESLQLSRATTARVPPSGEFVTTTGRITLTLKNQLPNTGDASLPTYAPNELVSGTIRVLAPESVTEILLKVGGRMDIGASGSGQQRELVKQTYTVWHNNNLRLMCPPAVPFSFIFPSTFTEEDSRASCPLPPTLLFKPPERPFIYVRCAYSISVLVSTALHPRFSLIRGEKVLDLAVNIRPTESPSRPIMPDPYLLTTVKAAPEEWHQVLCLFIPSAQTYALQDDIPFHLQITGAASMLRGLVPKRPSSPVPVRVHLERQVNISLRGQHITRSVHLGEGSLSTLPPPICSSEADAQIDWGGQLRVQANDSDEIGKSVSIERVSTFNSGPLWLEDFIVVSLPQWGVEHRHAVRFVSDTWTDDVGPGDRVR
uniref:BTB domain-containing protein n=1 Tax=Mycena chlorophos TaxID=658473 RepID=A0ABQ0LFI6_MYCCL|nr:predicted protein [Mycena chlorophos]